MQHGRARPFLHVFALLAIMAGGSIAAPSARAQVVSIVCDDADTRDPYPPMTFHIDLTNGTAESTGTSAFKVSAQVSERTIVWAWGSNRYTLDRASGVMNRIVDGRYTSTWRCRKVTGSAI